MWNRSVCILCDLLLLLRVILGKFMYIGHIAVICFHCCRELHYMHMQKYINSTLIHNAQ